MAWTVDGNTFRTTSAEASFPMSPVYVRRLALLKTDATAQSGAANVQVREGAIPIINTDEHLLATAGSHMAINYAPHQDMKDLSVVVTGAPGTFEVVVQVA